MVYRGFTDLNKCIKDDIDLSQLVNSNGFINLTDGNTYYYKNSVTPERCYKELLAYEIASFLGISCLQYKPVKLSTISGNHMGVISEDFKEPDTKYIYGEQILRDFYKDRLHEQDYPSNKKYNNLECIWYALEYRYRFLNNRSEIVERLMHDITRKVMMFDYLLANADRHSNNWFIKEKETDIELGLLFDNEDILLKSLYGKLNHPKFTVSNDFKDANIYENLKYFFRISTDEEYEAFKEYHELLSVENFINLINLTEEKHNITIPIGIKRDMIVLYKYHHKQLGKILKQIDKKEKKRLLIKK